MSQLECHLHEPDRRRGLRTRVVASCPDVDLTAHVGKLHLPKYRPLGLNRTSNMAQAYRRASAQIIVHSWAGTGGLHDSGRRTDRSGAQRTRRSARLQRSVPDIGPSTSLSIICYSDHWHPIAALYGQYFVAAQSSRIIEVLGPS